MNNVRSVLSVTGASETTETGAKEDSQSADHLELSQSANQNLDPTHVWTSFLIFLFQGRLKLPSRTKTTSQMMCANDYSLPSYPWLSRVHIAKASIDHPLSSALSHPAPAAALPSSRNSYILAPPPISKQPHLPFKRRNQGHVFVASIHVELPLITGLSTHTSHAAPTRRLRPLTAALLLPRCLGSWLSFDLHAAQGTHYPLCMIYGGPCYCLG